MNNEKIKELIKNIITLPKYEGDVLKKRTVCDTYHVGGLSGNRLNSGTLRSQFIICENESVWNKSDVSARRTIHTDQRVFVQVADDVWDVYTGDSLETENSDPKLIYANAQGLEQLLQRERQILLEESTKQILPKTFNLINNKQIIYYGAPGTGKSHIVKQKTQGESVVRTTFHPDSDYSTFVGAYKPTTEKVAIRDVTGKVIIENGLPVKENRIEYKFVEQAFLKAYIKAWKFYAEIEENAEPKKQYLIIEEINRGNCAQIFGDLFQLLDRNDYGFSDYYIHADKDIQKHLSEALNNLVIEESHKKKINSMFHEDVVEKVLSGEILLLPNNFYIWATMNTSDQSLFPIDSAFKRRWNWKYRPIVKGRDEEGNELNWKIVVANKEYDWWSFLEKINAVVASTTNSEDKKLGFFFCKAVDGVISAETFVDKVIFYLWNDVFKNFGFEDSIFNDEEDKSKLEFDKFYTTNPNGETIIRVDKVDKFLDNLKVEVIGEEIVDEEVNVNTTITVNDKKVKYINAIPYTAIEEYVNLNPNKSAQEIVAIWENFKKYSTRSWIICDKEGYNKIDPRYANYSYKIVCGDGEFVWVNKDGWMYHPKNQSLRDSISEFIKAVNEANLGISIKETIL
ncbi:MAG: AAA family ATPase [Bacteroidales bacterium]|nr:AAA family ATPase [Bacteroidales bacterium]